MGVAWLGPGAWAWRGRGVGGGGAGRPLAPPASTDPASAPPTPAAQTRTPAEGGGARRTVSFPEWTIKFQKFEKGGKKHPTPLWLLRRGRLRPCTGRSPAAVCGRRRGGRAGMGVTVDVHEVFKYPFEQVVASFLRKVLVLLRSGRGSGSLELPGAQPCAPEAAGSLSSPSPLLCSAALAPAAGCASGMCGARAGVPFLEGYPSRIPEKSPCAASRSHPAPPGGRGFGGGRVWENRSAGAGLKLLFTL